jgi:protein TonB
VYVSSSERATSPLAALGVMLLMAYALIVGLRVAWRPAGSAVLVAVGLAPPSPPPPSQRHRHPVKRAKSSAAEGEPAPANLRGHATPVVAPPRQLLIIPPPIAVATQAGIAAGLTTGAADRRGPGQGAGGIGNGNGGGGDGGDGYGDDAVVGPQQIRGRLKFSDVPEDILGPGQSASVGVRYTVETNGRVTHCSIDKSSRVPALDVLACRLIEQRFRFRPALDEDGRPVRSVVVETHSWSVQPDDGTG